MRRAGFLTLHRWLGLALAPFVLFQALTGTVLVLHELPARTPPARMASVIAFKAAAEAALPGARLTRLYLPGPGGDDAFAELSGPGYAALDGVTARVLYRGPLWHFPYRAAVQLHYRLAGGTPGMVLVALTGAVLMLSTLSGLVFWWPGRGRLVQALKVRPGLTPRVRLRQWHRTIGALAASLALFSATTGLLLIAPDLLATAPLRASAGPAPTARQIEAAIAAAQARFPGAVLRDVRFPAADRLDLNFAAPERNPRAVHVVWVRPSDGAVLKAIPAEANPVLWMRVLSLHTGQSFGPAGMALLLAEAAALVFLAIAGTRMWLTARNRSPR